MGPRLGAAYYPEQWPRDRWELDARLMAEAGLSLARVGEFAWARLEPEEGRLELDWLEEAISFLAGAGLDVIVGTPTAAPPAWLIERHPEILPVTGDGRRRTFGNRRHYCPNQPALHEATERVVGALGDRFGQDARVVAWQIDNEFGGRCFCETCRRAFQEWLRLRYGTLENLNEGWGTAFWSQTYSDWSQIPLPEGAPVPLPAGFLRGSPNPGLALDFRRFVSDSYVRFQRLQADILRARCSGAQRITHNLMGFGFPEIDYYELARDLDVVSWSNYPLLDSSRRWSVPALGADTMRGLKDSAIWVLEQQVGPLGWEIMHTPRPGELRLHTYQAVAHGAELVCYFRWRTARYGTEQYWHGILEHDGRRRRRFEEVRSLAAELERLHPRLDGLRPLAEAAIVNDYDSRFALQVQPTNAALAYEETAERHYGALRRLGLGVDVVPVRGDLSRYGLVVAPNLFVLDPAAAAALAEYVEQGGILVLAPRAGVKDRCNALPEGPLPAWLDELAGLEVAGYASGSGGARFEGSEISGEFGGWYEELELKGAKAVAAYLDGEAPGSAAIAEHEVGRGLVVYLAGAAPPATLHRVYEVLCEAVGLSVLELPEEVEIVRCGNGNGEEFVFVLNHGAAETVVDLGNGAWHDLVGERSGEGELLLPPHGVALLAEREAPLQAERAGGEARADR